MSSRRPRPDQQEYELKTITPTRVAIGDRTRTSMVEKPHFWMSTQIDVTGLVELRQDLRSKGNDVVPSYNDYILKATGLSLRENPVFNAWVAEDGLHLLKNVNVGFAVATEQGVLMPTLFDADTKPMTQIANETRELVNLARIGKLRASLQMGAGFSVSNIGPAEVDAFMAIISPPQTGIVAVGALKNRPMVVGDQVMVRKSIICTLSIDHAAADGADGAKFLGDLKAKLESREYLEALEY